MIVCSCNVITKQEIADTVLDFLSDNPWQLITPGMVYHAMAKRGECCGCFPGVIDIIIATTEDFHRLQNNPGNQVVAHLEAIRRAHLETEKSRQAVRTMKAARNAA